MIIERADRIIHLCEMKFSTDRYAITDNYEMKLRERMGLFRMATKTRKTLVITFVTTYGVVDGKHKSGMLLLRKSAYLPLSFQLLHQQMGDTPNCRLKAMEK